MELKTEVQALKPVGRPFLPCAQLEAPRSSSPRRRRSISPTPLGHVPRGSLWHSLSLTLVTQVLGDGRGPGESKPAAGGAHRVPLNDLK